ncbi:unnamed protein product [Adineta steineri]|uniref:Protein kinase domain-containing protein n=1 Tax=Adineta steineri TaxID=433720 RepID=A0A818SW64_9BILA|nr:unnamed protein product [Adineta steineri]
MERYRILGKKGEGTFSEVLKCQYIRDGTLWAVKKMKQSYKSMDEIQQIREIRILRLLNGHPNIIFLREIIFDKRTGTLCLIFELMTMNLYEYIRGRQRLLTGEVVKPENILIKDDILKLADFGSCQQTFSKQPFTEYISTRWYRAPECLLTNGYYRDATDIWSTGCVMYEITTLRPLFPGSNELDQISKIHDVLGTPTSSTLEKFQHRNTAVDFNFPPRRGTGIARRLSHCSSDTTDLINQLCVYDPDHRITAAQALRHPYFNAIRTEENQQIPATADDASWITDVQVIKTNEDNHIRSNSSSSKSSTDEPITSTRSNVYNSPAIHQQLFDPTFHRLLHPPPKAQSLIDTRVHGHSIKKSPVKYKNTIKSKYAQPHYPSSQYKQSQLYYTNLSSMGTSGLPHHSSPNIQLIKSTPSPFLPKISAASAFSTYSPDVGYSVQPTNKVK